MCPGIAQVLGFYILMTGPTCVVATLMIFSLAFRTMKCLKTFGTFIARKEYHPPPWVVYDVDSKHPSGRCDGNPYTFWSLLAQLSDRQMLQCVMQLCL